MDFCCVEAMLVVEVDSSYHDGRRAEDAARDRELKGRGHAVVRISAREIATNLDGVLDTLLRVSRERIEAMKKGKKG